MFVLSHGKFEFRYTLQICEATLPPFSTQRRVCRLKVSFPLVFTFPEMIFDFATATDFLSLGRDKKKDKTHSPLTI